MCGIGGYFARTVRAPEVAERMLSTLRPRGPDAQGLLFWDARWQRSAEVAHNALLHTRLAIIDPCPRSNQPMGNRAGDVWISYNGEVYDWQEDARLLQAQGYHFDTSSDTEFILHAYEAWGLDMLPRLRGKFALALLDLRQNCLWLLSDRLGQKSIVYYHDGAEFAFASTVRALLPFLPAAQRQLNAAAIDAYLAHRYIPTPATIFSAIHRLPPGHALRFDLHSRELQLHPYWSLQEAERPSKSWQDELAQAIQLRTTADRPVGLLLSGGIDSAVIAWHLAASQHREISSYTVAFDDPVYDESAITQRMADELQLPLTKISFRSDWFQHFEAIVADLDEPFADPGAFPLWILIRQLADQVKVVLTGDGGDELLAGYKRYRQHLHSAWRGPLRLPLPILAQAQAKGWRKTLTEASMSWQDAYSLRFSGMTPNQRRWLQPDYCGPHTYWRQAPTRASNPLQQLLDIDRINVLPDYILRKADLCSMSHGVELRSPMLDHRFVSALLSRPQQELYTPVPKAIFTQVCPLITSLRLLKNKKRGFSPPLGAALRQGLADRLPELGRRLATLSAGQLDAARTQHMVDSWQRGEHGLDEHILQLLILDVSLSQLKTLAES